LNVVVERLLRRHAWLLQLDDYQRKPVDEPDEIGTAGIERAGDAESAREQEVVVRGILPVDDADSGLALSAAFTVGNRNANAVLQEQVDFAVGGDLAHRGSIGRELVDRGGDTFGRHSRIEPVQGRPKARHQHDLARRLSPERSVRPQELVARVDRCPP
jgi:hypothetical protein